MPMRRSTLEVRKRLRTLRPRYFGERPRCFPADRNPYFASGCDDFGVCRLPCLGISGEW